MDKPIKNYDKMTAVIITLNDEGMEYRSHIIRLLSVLLSVTEPVETRKNILENDFHIPMTREFEEEMQVMKSYGDAIQRYGEQIGKQEGWGEAIFTSIKNVMEAFKVSAKQAMEALKIPESVQVKYEKLL